MNGQRRRTEHDLGRWLRRDLERCGALVCQYAPGRRGRSGWPDLRVVHAVWHGDLELKGAGTAVEPLQRETLKQMGARWPGCAWVVREGVAGRLLVQSWDGETTAECSRHASALLLALAELCPWQGAHAAVALGALAARLKDEGGTYLCRTT